VVLMEILTRQIRCTCQNCLTSIHRPDDGTTLLWFADPELQCVSALLSLNALWPVTSGQAIFATWPERRNSPSKPTISPTESHSLFNPGAVGVRATAQQSASVLGNAVHRNHMSV
jgi:hypothetical protein